MKEYTSCQGGGGVGREAGFHVEVIFDLDFGSDVIMWYC